jgi:hypothetical protein
MTPLGTVNPNDFLGKLWMRVDNSIILAKTAPERKNPLFLNDVGWQIVDKERNVSEPLDSWRQLWCFL